VPDWQQRVLTEHSELTKKMVGLAAFINQPGYLVLTALEQELLAQQLQVMTAYQLVLAARIKRF
jgi:hypothetical protein